MTNSQKEAILNNFREQCISLRRHTGAQKYSNAPCVLKRLTEADLPKVNALHTEIVESTSRELLIPTTDEDLMGILSGEGIALWV